MDDELTHRMGRIYAAISAVEEPALESLKARVIKTQRFAGVCQDFRNGLSDEQLSNLAHSLIHNIAYLRDHLRKWAAQNGQDKNRVNEQVDRSFALQVIIDLSDSDKHGYPPRDGGRSGKCPKLVEVNRVLRLATKPEAGSAIAVTLGCDGTPKVFGSGSAKAVITGDVLDKHNNMIGDLRQIETEALEAWEHLLQDFNVAQSILQSPTRR